MRSACVARRLVMRPLCVALIVVAAVACHRPTYLPVATLRQTAPPCGTYPVAPRPGDHGPTYFGCQVDRAAQPPLDRPLDYPPLLADAGVESDVQLQFVVDERGRVDSTTIKVLASGHDLFTRAAQESIRRWEVRPARLRGRAVRQLTTHAFCFRIGGTGALARCGRELPRYPAGNMSVACADGTSTICSSHGGCRRSAPRRPPNVRCS